VRDKSRIWLAFIIVDLLLRGMDNIKPLHVSFNLRPLLDSESFETNLIFSRSRLQQQFMKCHVL